MTELEDLRAEKDEHFKHSSQSPLTAEQRRDFTGLNYFAENPALRLEVEVEEFGPKPEIEMQTSTGGAQHYKKFGRFSFTVDGELATLTIYLANYGYFLPFVDALANKETYGAGRYLEPEPLGGGKFLVDFNTAYNPYCAYNDAWSCPLTPFENRVKVAVRAGEKVFPGTIHE
jgi:uncharacterized protein (DUF1684 family)